MPLDSLIRPDAALDRDLRILQRARDGLRESWGQGSKRVANCAVDWVREAARGESTVFSYVTAVTERWLVPELPLPLRFFYKNNPIWALATFNDAPWRRQARVVALFDAAVRRVEAARSSEARRLDPLDTLLDCAPFSSSEVTPT